MAVVLQSRHVLLSIDVLVAAVAKLASAPASLPYALLQADDAMDTDAAAPPAAPAENGAAPAGLLPEVEAYAFLLVVTFLVDRKRYKGVRARLGRSGCGSDGGG